MLLQKSKIQTVGNRKTFLFSNFISEIPNFSKNTQVGCRYKMPEDMVCMDMCVTLNHRSFNDGLYKDKKNQDLYNA